MPLHVFAQLSAVWLPTKAAGAARLACWLVNDDDDDAAAALKQASVPLRRERLVGVSTED